MTQTIEEFFKDRHTLSLRFNGLKYKFYGIMYEPLDINAFIEEHKNDGKEIYDKFEIRYWPMPRDNTIRKIQSICIDGVMYSKDQNGLRKYIKDKYGYDNDTDFLETKPNERDRYTKCSVYCRDDNCDGTFTKCWHPKLPVITQVKYNNVVCRYNWLAQIDVNELIELQQDNRGKATIYMGGCDLKNPRDEIIKFD